MTTENLQQLAEELDSLTTEELKQVATHLHDKGSNVGLISFGNIVPPTCPTGTYWNGSQCVLNVG